MAMDSSTTQAYDRWVSSPKTSPTSARSSRLAKPPASTRRRRGALTLVLAPHGHFNDLHRNRHAREILIRPSEQESPTSSAGSSTLGRPAIRLLPPRAPLRRPENPRHAD